MRPTISRYVAAPIIVFSLAGAPCGAFAGGDAKDTYVSEETCSNADAGKSPVPELRWVPGPKIGDDAVEVRGLAKPCLDALRAWEPTSPRWSRFLRVSVARAGSGDSKVAPPAILGRYAVTGDSLKFTPKYPFDYERKYSAEILASELPGAESATWSSIRIDFITRKAEFGPPTRLLAVFPSSDVLPENQLKFYLHFSAPMSRGEVYRRIRLREVGGDVVELPFIEIDQELWDPAGKRITLLFDPGRIKRGLRPREEEGPILVEGKQYEFIVDKSWADADGRPLVSGITKRFKVGPPDDKQPAIKDWVISSPASKTTESLSIVFPDPIDRAMLDHAIALKTPEGRPVEGRVVVEKNETVWRFIPVEIWRPGQYRLVVETALEDLAGNSIARPFEVDIQRSTPLRRELGTVESPVSIR